MESTVPPTSATVIQSVSPSTTHSSCRSSVNSEPTPRHLRRTHSFRQPHYLHRRRHHNHSQPHSPPIYPFFASPHPLYLYSRPASPPVIHIPQLGSSALSPRSKNGIICLAAPVYMIPVLALVYQPMPGLAYAAPPINSQPAPSQPAQSQPTQSQPATNPPTSV